MPALKNTFQSIGTHIGGLSGTAKLLIGSLMVILVLALLFVAQLTGKPALVPLNANLTSEAQTRAVSYLQTSNIQHEVVAGEVLVPPDKKYTVLAHLTEGQVLDAEQIDFEKLIAEDSPFLTRDQHDKRWMIAKMNVLSSLISSFQDIERATVVIDKPARRGFGGTHIEPTASVHVVPHGELASSEVEAIAYLIAGSQAGLKPANVRVIDAKTGKRHQPRSDSEMESSKYLELQTKVESTVRSKIERFLGYIPGVRVEVNAIVDSRAVEEHNQGYQEPKIGPVRERNETRDQVVQSSPTEPGVLPNSSVQIASGARTSTLAEDKTDNLSKSKFGSDTRLIHDPKGYPLKINATIGVPRSYFVAKYRMDVNDPAATPDETTLAAVITAQTEVIKRAVEPLTDTVAREDDTILGTVEVAVIPDVSVAGGFGPGGGRSPEGGDGVIGGSGSGPGSILNGDLLKHVGLGGLALLALALMLMMVRKASRMELPSAEEVAGVPPTLPTDEDAVVGEAETSDLALEGVELDNNQLRRQQMVEQISNMVGEDPDEVANLLRRWIRVEA